MQPLNFEDALKKIVAVDARYHRDAYLFMREALEHTQRAIGKPKRDEIRHVSGRELLEGIRAFAIEQFGPMAEMVFCEWGVRSCEDFGEIVFVMIEHNLLAKTDRDSREDFKGGYDFHDAFRKPYIPSRKPAPSPVKPVSA